MRQTEAPQNIGEIEKRNVLSLLGSIAREPIPPSGWLAGDFREFFLTLAGLLGALYRQDKSTLHEL